MCTALAVVDTGGNEKGCSHRAIMLRIWYRGYDGGEAHIAATVLMCAPAVRQWAVLASAQYLPSDLQAPGPIERKGTTQESTQSLDLKYNKYSKGDQS